MDTMQRRGGRVRRLGWVRAAASLAGAALLLSACTGSGASGSTKGEPAAAPDDSEEQPGVEPSPIEGGFLRFGGAESSIDSLNPFVSVNVFGMSAINYAYPKLVQYDDDLELIPDLATSWEQSEDGTTITFQLPAGTTWSDGEPLTSGDVAWTLQTIVAYADGPAAALGMGITGLETVEAPDETTVVLTYDGPYASALPALQTVPILPAHVWEPIAGEDGAELQTFENAPPIVAGGPFTITEFKRDEIVLFERNDAYYGDPPAIEGFGIRHFSNADALVTALRNGEVDAALELPAVHLSAFEGDDDWDVVSTPSFVWHTIGFNSNSDKPERTELLEPGVRRALAMAVDVEELVRVIEDGRGEPLATQLPAAYQSPDLPPLPRDVEGANQLLDDLGYLRGDDGIRMVDGRRMSYELLASDGLGHASRRVEMVAGYVADIGIELTPRVLDGTAFWAEVTGPDGRFEQADLFLDSWANVPDPSLILSIVTCDARGGLSQTGYCNPAYDELFLAQASTTEPDERAPIIDQLQEILYEDRPFSPLYLTMQSEVWSPDWEGYWLSPLGSFSFLSKLPLESVHQAA